MSCFCDLHLHVLPEIDDGARSLNESLEILKGLVSFGFTQFVATPHLDETRHRYGVTEISDRAVKLQTVLRESSDLQALTLDTGGEYAYGARFLSELKQQKLTTLSQSALVLVELPESFLPTMMPDVFRALCAARYKPVIAHPERCLYFEKNMNKLEQLKKIGAAIQVSFRSLSGAFGRDISRLAWHLIERGVCDLLATDLHHTSELKTVVEPVFHALERHVPREMQRLLSITPRALLGTVR